MAGQPLPPMERRKEVLLERWHSHTMQCKSCQQVCGPLKNYTLHLASSLMDPSIFWALYLPLFLSQWSCGTMSLCRARSASG